MSEKTPTQVVDDLQHEITSRGTGCIFVMDHELAPLFELARHGAQQVEGKTKLLAALEKVRASAEHPSPIPHYCPRRSMNHNDTYMEDRFGGTSLCAIRMAPRQHCEPEIVADLADAVMKLEEEAETAGGIILNLNAEKLKLKKALEDALAIIDANKTISALREDHAEDCDKQVCWSMECSCGFNQRRAEIRAAL